VLAHLEGLEPIRNDIAHSREISEGAVAMLRAAFYVLCQFIRLPREHVELPATDHLEIVIRRVRAAIENHAPVSGLDLRLIESDTESHELSAAIAAYARVRERPGRPLKLLQEVEVAALKEIQTHLDGSK
jgi:hypothetical protein